MKIRIITCIMAALLVCTNASVWEGAASIVSGGELPDEGYYAATNSFPRNTVVDITNLETGKSIRVIVATGLETPGLLAVLSREAAEIIGLRPRSIGRIRMTQPSDPVAFSRFTEGLASNGDPDYDPRALVAADPLVKDLYLHEESPALPPANPPGRPDVPAQASGAGPDFESEPEEIVDVFDYYNPPASSSEDEGIAREPDLAWVYETENDETTAESEEAAGMPAVTEERPEVFEPTETGGLADLPETEIPETSLAPGGEPETGLHIAEEPGLSEAEAKADTDTKADIDVDVNVETKAEAEAEREGPDEAEFDYTLVPAEERPPEEYPGYTLPPEAEVLSTPVRPGEAIEAPAIDESLFIPPIEKAAAEPTYPGYLEKPDLSPSLFSVPMINNLERGKYYLQLGAFSRAEAAESELNRLGKTYPLSIQNGGSAEKPVYRILVGPVNLGESGALLRRFKSIGYHDAFVRTGS